MNDHQYKSSKIAKETERAIVTVFRRIAAYHPIPLIFKKRELFADILNQFFWFMSVHSKSEGLSSLPTVQIIKYNARTPLQSLATNDGDS